MCVCKQTHIERRLDLRPEAKAAYAMDSMIDGQPSIRSISQRAMSDSPQMPQMHLRPKISSTYLETIYYYNYLSHYDENLVKNY